MGTGEIVPLSVLLGESAGLNHVSIGADSASTAQDSQTDEHPLAAEDKECYALAVAALLFSIGRFAPQAYLNSFFPHADIPISDVVRSMDVDRTAVDATRSTATATATGSLSSSSASGREDPLGPPGVDSARASGSAVSMQFLRAAFGLSIFHHSAVVSDVKLKYANIYSLKRHKSAFSFDGSADSCQRRDDFADASLVHAARFRLRSRMAAIELDPYVSSTQFRDGETHDHFLSSRQAWFDAQLDALSRYRRKTAMKKVTNNLLKNTLMIPKAFIKAFVPFLVSPQAKQNGAPPMNLYGRAVVQVLEARDLLAKDLNGFSDPFCEITLKGSQTKQKLRTRTMYKTLHPVWENEQLVLDVPKEDRERSIFIRMWDEDLLKKADFLGQVEIPLADLPLGIPTSKWYPLQKRSRKSHVAGDLHLLIYWQNVELLLGQSQQLHQQQIEEAGAAASSSETESASRKSTSPISSSRRSSFDLDDADEMSDAAGSSSAASFGPAIAGTSGSSSKEAKPRHGWWPFHRHPQTAGGHARSEAADGSSGSSAHGQGGQQQPQQHDDLSIYAGSEFFDPDVAYPALRTLIRRALSANGQQSTIAPVGLRIIMEFCMWVGIDPVVAQLILTEEAVAFYRRHVLEFSSGTGSAAADHSTDERKGLFPIDHLRRLFDSLVVRSECGAAIVARNMQAVCFSFASLVKGNAALLQLRSSVIGDVADFVGAILSYYDKLLSPVDFAEAFALFGYLSSFSEVMSARPAWGDLHDLIAQILLRSVGKMTRVLDSEERKDTLAVGDLTACVRACAAKLSTDMAKYRGGVPAGFPFFDMQAQMVYRRVKAAVDDYRSQVALHQQQQQQQQLASNNDAAILLSQALRQLNASVIEAMESTVLSEDLQLLSVDALFMDNYKQFLEQSRQRLSKFCQSIIDADTWIPDNQPPPADAGQQDSKRSTATPAAVISQAEAADEDELLLLLPVSSSVPDLFSALRQFHSKFTSVVPLVQQPPAAVAPEDQQLVARTDQLYAAEIGIVADVVSTYVASLVAAFAAEARQRGNELQKSLALLKTRSAMARGAGAGTADDIRGQILTAKMAVMISDIGGCRQLLDHLQSFIEQSLRSVASSSSSSSVPLQQRRQQQQQPQREQPDDENETPADEDPFSAPLSDDESTSAEPQLLLRQTARPMATAAAETVPEARTSSPKLALEDNFDSIYRQLRTAQSSMISKLCELFTFAFAQQIVENMLGLSQNSRRKKQKLAALDIPLQDPQLPATIPATLDGGSGAGNATRPQPSFFSRLFRRTRPRSSSVPAAKVAAPSQEEKGAAAAAAAAANCWGLGEDGKLDIGDRAFLQSGVDALSRWLDRNLDVAADHLSERVVYQLLRQIWSQCIVEEMAFQSINLKAQEWTPAVVAQALEFASCLATSYFAVETSKDGRTGGRTPIMSEIEHGLHQISVFGGLATASDDILIDGLKSLIEAAAASGSRRADLDQDYSSLVLVLLNRETRGNKRVRHFLRQEQVVGASRLQEIEFTLKEMMARHSS